MTYTCFSRLELSIKYYLLNAIYIYLQGPTVHLNAEEKCLQRYYNHYRSGNENIALAGLLDNCR